MSSAELLELERIQANFGQIVYLTEQQFDKLQRGRIIYVDRETSKPLVPVQRGDIDSASGGKLLMFQLLSQMPKFTW